jgi:mRNA interferase RelE/StbE
MENYYNVIISKKVKKELDNIPKVYLKSILRVLKELETTPRPNGYRKLKGYEDLYRIRTGVYRIIYSIEENILRIEVLKVSHRKDAYSGI